MIIVSKKRLGVIVTIVLVSICTFIINSRKVEYLSETVPTVALPVSNKVIIVDAGHGKPDEGAESSTRYYRGTNKFKNSTKITRSIRTIRSNRDTHKVR